VLRNKKKKIINEYEKFPVKKMVLLLVLTGVWFALLFLHFFRKPEIKPLMKGYPAQAGVSTRRLPIPSNFEKLSPKLQEHFLKRSRQAE
jgi:hypothetical protein